MKILSYKPGHLDFLTPKKEYDYVPKDMINNLHTYCGKDIYTLYHENKVLAILGFTPLWTGCMEAWSVTSDDVRDFPVHFHRTSSDILNMVFDRDKLHRVQLTVKEGFDESIRWVEKLGFKREGLMLKYDKLGNNHYLYARTV